MPGASRHNAWIYERGGRKRLFEIKNPAEIVYSRQRDDTSTATVKVQPSAYDAQIDDLDGIEPGKHELHIFRNDTRRLAWCGPVNIPESQNVYGLWELSANDVSFYLDRLAMESGYDNSAAKVDYVVTRIANIIRKELAAQGMDDEWDLISHLHAYVQTGDARTTARTYRYQSTVFDHLDDLAARSGIDYTVIGREIHIWDTSRPALGQGPVITRADFTSEPTKKKYGSELATRVIATDGQGGFGVAGGRDPYYGKFDIVVQAYDAETDSAKPTAAELRSQAILSLKGRNPTPMQLTVPENTSVDPSSPLYDLDLLVPGTYFPLQLQSGRSTPVHRMQKLQSVQVTDNAEGETIAISLYPAAGYGSADEDLGV